MVSIGPSTQSHNFTHMYDIPDLRGCLPRQAECPNSLMAIISKHPDFSKFRYMVKLGKLEGVLNGVQADFTIFIPSDRAIAGLGDAVFINMDDATARHIVKSSMLNRKIPSELLEDSPASYFLTRDPPNRLFITNISGRTYINNDINVIHKDLMTSNGIIHVVDNLIWPEII
jgi:uncharacterized surface protein with fasciclin (FAS1) repeats